MVVVVVIVIVWLMLMGKEKLVIDEIKDGGA